MAMGKRLKSYFFRGLAVILPTFLTIWILVWGYKFIQGNISIHISRGLVWLIMRVQGGAGATQEVLEEIFISGIGSLVGFIIALIVVLIVGAALASVVGKTLWRLVEKFIMRTPFLRQVYPYIKQITDFVFTEDEQKNIFSKVVAVEYPRKGIWSMGMVTGSGLKKVIDHVEKEILTLLIPTSPTPFTGFVIMVPKEQTIDLDITIEQALRFAVSGGVITPDSELSAFLNKDD